MRWSSWPSGGKVWGLTQGTGMYTGSFTKTTYSDAWIGNPYGSNTSLYRERLALEVVSAANSRPVGASGTNTARMTMQNGKSCPKVIDGGKTYFDVNVGDPNRYPRDTLKIADIGGQIGNFNVSMPDQTNWGMPQVPAPCYGPVRQSKSGNDWIAEMTARWSGINDNWAGTANLAGKYYMYSNCKVYLKLSWAPYTITNILTTAPCYVGKQSTPTRYWKIKHNMNVQAGSLKVRYMKHTNVGGFSGYVTPTAISNSECQIDVGGNYSGIAIVENIWSWGGGGIPGNYPHRAHTHHMNYGYYINAGKYGAVLKFRVRSDGTVTGINTDRFTFRSHYWINAGASYWADLTVRGNYG